MTHPFEQRLELVEDTPEPQDHPAGCLCTSCTTERFLERAGRYDKDIVGHLQHIKQLRRVPVSAGDGEKASGAAALADSAVRESVPNRIKGAA